MRERIRQPEVDEARNLMRMMISVSQRPGVGNQEFVKTVGSHLRDCGYYIKEYPDPELEDRAVLAIEIGDPYGEQILAALSHSDVVGIEHQTWDHDPWTLHEEDNKWFGRGVCDTHGSGVAMLLAGGRKDLQEKLRSRGQRITILFTYDEEAAEPELSYRGARRLIGQLGSEKIVTCDNFVVGEPTELNGKIRAMKSHKGRWLAHFTVKVEHPGHVSDKVQNALMVGCGVVSKLSQYADVMKLGSKSDEVAGSFDPPYSTLQISAGDVKSHDYSTTPDEVRFTLDMRTLPDIHSLRVTEVRDLIENFPLEDGVKITLEVVSDETGSASSDDSLIAQAARIATDDELLGFNGGDEGYVLRLDGGMEGVTIGPGRLAYAHKPNEQVDVVSIIRAADIYSELFQYISDNTARSE